MHSMSTAEGHLPSFSFNAAEEHFKSVNFQLGRGVLRPSFDGEIYAQLGEQYLTVLDRITELGAKQSEAHSEYLRATNGMSREEFNELIRDNDRETTLALGINLFDVLDAKLRADSLEVQAVPLVSEEIALEGLFNLIKEPWLIQPEILARPKKPARSSPPREEVNRAVEKRYGMYPDWLITTFLAFPGRPFSYRDLSMVLFAEEHDQGYTSTLNTRTYLAIKDSPRITRSLSEQQMKLTILLVSTSGESPKLRLICTPAYQEVEPHHIDESLRLTAGELREWGAQLRQEEIAKQRLMIEQGIDPRQRPSKKREGQKTSRHKGRKAATAEIGSKWTKSQEKKADQKEQKQQGVPIRREIDTEWQHHEKGAQAEKRKQITQAWRWLKTYHEREDKGLKKTGVNEYKAWNVRDERADREEEAGWERYVQERITERQRLVEEAEQQREDKEERQRQAEEQRQRELETQIQAEETERKRLEAEAHVREEQEKNRLLLEEAQRQRAVQEQLESRMRQEREEEAARRAEEEAERLRNLSPEELERLERRRKRERQGIIEHAKAASTLAERRAAQRAELLKKASFDAANLEKPKDIKPGRLREVNLEVDEEEPNPWNIYRY